MSDNDVDNGNKIYYRIGFDGQEIAICTLQWFDEDDN
jgi:hypothetical protein